MNRLVLFLSLALAFALSAQAAAPATFQAIYDENRRLGRANYITQDYLFTVYGQLFEAGLSRAEEQQMRPAFSRMVSE